MPESTGRKKTAPAPAGRGKANAAPAGNANSSSAPAGREKANAELADESKTAPFKGAERALGYSFRDKRLLKVCFTHASVADEESNERLEFLGDAVLELYVTEKLYRDSAAREGELTELRKRYVSREALSAAEEKLGLLAFLHYAGGEDALKGKTASNLYEAAVGAIYLDGGYAAAQTFLARTLIETDIGNYKTALQEFVQQREHATPVYETREEGDEFVCEVHALGAKACGRGGSKKLAEQAAAKLLIGKLTEQ